MKVSVKKVSDRNLPDDKTQAHNVSRGFLSTPGQGQRNRKPRDSFAVMRARNQKHSIGITLPKNKPLIKRIFGVLCCSGSKAPKVKAKQGNIHVDENFNNLVRECESDKISTPNRLK